MKVTPPLAVAPLAQEDDMRWNPNDDGIINMYPYTYTCTLIDLIQSHEAKTYHEKIEILN